MHDDRLSKKTRGTDHVTLTCKNHPDLRWSTKNIPGRSIFFRGQKLEAPVTIQERVWADPDTEHPNGYLTDEVHDVEITFKRSAEMPNPFKVLHSRMTGVNPYDTRIPDLDNEGNPPIHTWEQVLEFVEYVARMQERFSFECPCPMRDLVLLEDESAPDVEM